MRYMQDWRKEETKGTPILNWIQWIFMPNIDQDLASLGLTLR